MISVPNTTDSQADGWFVVWTESRAEKKVASRIAALGIEPWLPKVTERRRWSDRWTNVVLPLFPGYLFARGGPATLNRLLRTPGVLTIVKDGARPARLSDAFVSSLRRSLEFSGVTATPVAERVAYAPDDEVIVQNGPLAGARGVVRELRGARQLVIWVKEVGRGVAFTIESALVARPIGA
jgi:transcription antitermination factor NusG